MAKRTRRSKPYYGAGTTRSGTRFKSSPPARSRSRSRDKNELTHAQRFPHLFPQRESPPLDNRGRFDHIQADQLVSNELHDARDKEIRELTYSIKDSKTLEEIKMKEDAVLKLIYSAPLGGRKQLQWRDTKRQLLDSRVYLAKYKLTKSDA